MSRLFKICTVIICLTLVFLLDHQAIADTHAREQFPITVPQTITIAAGYWLAGSSPQEREMAYQLDEIAYGHAKTRERKWYENERELERRFLKTFEISRTPITNQQYANFVHATGHKVPDVDQITWQSYNLIHPYERTRRHAWRSNVFPAGRGEHPVVLVSIDDTHAYARWLSEQTGETWRLPSEDEFEKAARGTEGLYFPWGNTFDPVRLNSHDNGPFDTIPAGSFPRGRSPYGMLDSAGQVFEWTSSRNAADRYVVKGGSWDDKGCGICRPAARHARPGRLKHILIGFRLVRVIE